MNNIDKNKESKRELEDVLYIQTHTSTITAELDSMTNDQVINQYDYSKIEKLSRKVNRLKSAEKLHERYLYDLDEIAAKVDAIVSRVVRILTQELKDMINQSNFFATQDEPTSLVEHRKVFMILKSFKQLLNSEAYVYRTINNEIIEPEFKVLVQKALKSKSLISPTDRDFDKTKLPLCIFIEGAMKIFLEGNLKNLIKM